jgi:hypothetical protein
MTITSFQCVIKPKTQIYPRHSVQVELAAQKYLEHSVQVELAAQKYLEHSVQVEVAAQKYLERSVQVEVAVGLIQITQAQQYSEFESSAIPCIHLGAFPFSWQGFPRERNGHLLHFAHHKGRRKVQEMAVSLPGKALPRKWECAPFIL